MFPPSIQNLINHFKTLPDIGSKTAERLVFYLLQKPKTQIKEFAQALENIAKQISHCPVCFNFSENEDGSRPALCHICSNRKREKTTICVVANNQDLEAIERTAEYKGVYHILGGLIDQINGIKPEHLNIPALLKRIEQKNPEIQEVILALDATIEGESTTLYLIRRLKNYEIIISRLSRGLPMGANLNYADAVTLTQALMNRSQI